ncbi:dihydrofolate reductase family protein [Arthrobacter sp. NPDC058097]|uniref:dihydrofolate reductase family protein n=1 Tax=Arthrobacter sp. NPDC058097 TaxID=3346340 RepID=UPI0036D95967
MRRTVVNNIVSLDGFYADQSGNPTVLNMDETFDAYNLERLRSAGTVLLGRTSFEGFGAYWPAIADADEDPNNRALSSDNREISRLYNRVAKMVVSDSLEVPADHPWVATTTVIRREDAGEWLEQEKQHGSGDILIFGSRVMWNGLLAQGLVDELHLTVSPAALTEGQPLFLEPANLTLLDVRPFPGSSNALLRYRPASV